MQVIEQKGGSSIESIAKAKLIAKAGDELKAQSITVMDVRKVANFTEYFVICTGGSNTQISAISANIQKRLSAHKKKPFACEGTEKDSWVVLDYGDVIIHLFDKEKRLYYDLERLWGDAKFVDWEN